MTATLPLIMSATINLPGKPDTTYLPGSGTLFGLANGVEGWALVAALAGVVIGAIIWAFGQYSHNYQQAYNGRRGVLVSGLAAILIGGAPQLISFFEQQGAKLH
jgi:MFS family permease